MSDSASHPSWKEQQRALTARAKMVRRWHPKLIQPGAVLTTGDGSAYRVTHDGSFVRMKTQVEPDRDRLLKQARHIDGTLKNLAAAAVE